VGGAGEVFVSQAQARLSTAGGCNTASTTTTTETSSIVESGIEETSISAASVIRKFESATSEQQLRASTGSLAVRMNAVGGGSEQDAAGVNANLLQETVSSKLKKVSKEEMSSSRAETAGEYRFKERYLYYCTTECSVVSSMDCLLISFLRLNDKSFRSYK
jgi:hypothetical protein